MARKKKTRRKSNSTAPALLVIAPIVVLICAYWIKQNPIKAERRVLSRIEHIDYAECPAPGYRDDEVVLYRNGYTVSYNRQWGLPNWVAYELIPAELDGDTERKNRFITDLDLTGRRAKSNDYTHSGYDRGHMAPAADMKWSDTAMKESFYMSNICPQVPGLNRGRWKELEDAVRNWCVQDSALLIVCGPIVTEKHTKIGANRIAVPDRFFKAIVAPYLSEPRGIAFIFENRETSPSLPALAVSIDSLEQVLCADLFHLLPDSIENIIERQINLEAWNLE